MLEDSSICEFLHENYIDVCESLKVEFNMFDVKCISTICKYGDYTHDDDAHNVSV